MKERTIKITELKCDTYSKKDNSPRGCQVVSRTDVRVGDYIVILSFSFINCVMVEFVADNLSIRL